ncbi:MAG: hypothetical protein JWO11_865 [Nocardioides sp.]|nr:hypothetical protein [Nocardioides sp.]
MPIIRFRSPITGALIKCKRCGVEHNNPLKHACVVTMAELGKPASMRKAAKKAKR